MSRRRSLGVLVALLPASASSDRHPLLIAAKDLPRLSGALYEGWVVKGDRKLSAGVFNVRERPVGQLVVLRSPIDPARADLIVVTIKPVPDPDPGRRQPGERDVRRLVPGSGGRSGPVAEAAAGARGLGVRGLGRDAGTPLTTGRFTSVTGTDLASPFTGPNPGPPFPGEDFLTGLPAGIVSPVNLADGGSMVVIMVEPDLGG